MVASVSDRLFLDNLCKEPFPITLPPGNEMIFHRIVVAHGSASRCRAVFGGSGSLMIKPSLVDEDHHDPTSSGYALVFHRKTKRH